MDDARTRIQLTSGGDLVVDARLEAAEKQLSDAARSGQSRLAWFTESESGASVGVNPAHVVSMTGPGDPRAGGA